MTQLIASTNPIASIVILSYEDVALLRDCLSAIARSTKTASTPYEVLVLFQQMSQDTVDAFVAEVRGIRPLHARLNLGFGGGANFAAKHAKGKYLVFLNDDSEVHPGWLDALVAAAQSDERVGAVGSRVLFPDGTLQEAGGIIWSDGSTMPLGRGERPGSLAYSYVRAVDYTSANGMLVRRDDFDRLGGFDMRYFPAYYEDTDLCLALRHQLEREIVYEPRSLISHLEAASSNDADFRAFLFRRNQAFLAEKWHDVLQTYPSPKPDSPRAIEAAVSRRRGAPRVLVIDDRLPDAGAGSGGLGSGFVRASELFADLKSCAVSAFVTHRPRRNTLAELGVDVMDEPLANHLAHPGKTYDAMVISRPHNFRFFCDTVRAALPGVPLIYDAEALYHKRLWLQARLECNDERRDLIEARARDTEELERHIARAADLLVTISPEERAWLESVDGHAPIKFMPPLLSGIEVSPAALDGRAGAVFVAGWLGGTQSPNVDALRWYCDEVLPLVRAALPHFRTIVTGKSPPPAVQALASDALVLTGFVESIARMYRNARVAIVPMRIGAGVKNKTMEALQSGVPVVATAVGAEGLDLHDGDDADVADDPAAFAQRLIALATDDALWYRRRQALERRMQAWEVQRVTWRDVIERALTTRGADARSAS
ncbi:MAG TPA: glycosyltransferase [Candidatus Baltobacteraceae bacterium]